MEQINIIVKGSAYGILFKDTIDRITIKYYALDGSEITNYNDRKPEIDAIVSDAKVFCIHNNLTLWKH